MQTLQVKASSVISRWRPSRGGVGLSRALRAASASSLHGRGLGEGLPHDPLAGLALAAPAALPADVHTHPVALSQYVVGEGLVPTPFCTHGGPEMPWDGRRRWWGCGVGGCSSWAEKAGLHLEGGDEWAWFHRKTLLEYLWPSFLTERFYLIYSSNSNGAMTGGHTLSKSLLPVVRSSDPQCFLGSLCRSLSKAESTLPSTRAGTPTCPYVSWRQLTHERKS